MKLHCLLLFLSTVGLANAASLPATGPHKIEHPLRRNFESRPGRTVAVDIWHPTYRARGPFPLLLFSPGFGNRSSQYLSQLEDLASHGYVVVGLEHSVDALDSFESRAVLWAQDILAAKEEVFRSPIREILDSRRIGAFGYSLGGRASSPRNINS
jgi:predicted dienelactone hydrolase